MNVDGKWIYWKDQCHYCTKAKNCYYEPYMKDYIQKLDDVSPSSPVYGSLTFKCDYLELDIEKYEKEHLAESCCVC